MTSRSGIMTSFYEIADCKLQLADLLLTADCHDPRFARRVADAPRQPRLRARLHPDARARRRRQRCDLQAMVSERFARALGFRPEQIVGHHLRLGTIVFEPTPREI